MGGRAILVFAKAPVAGRVKTRLIPVLGAEGAAMLAQRLLESAVDTAAGVEGVAVELHCAPDAGHPLFHALAARHGATLHVQEGRDLGARMHRALTRAAARHRHLVLIGTDCPGMDGAYLDDAFRALEGGAPLVVGPAEDGGYVLIGCSAPPPAFLFEGIDWGTARVLAQTRARAAALGLRHLELPSLRDLDRPDDVPGRKHGGA